MAHRSKKTNSIEKKTFFIFIQNFQVERSPDFDVPEQMHFDLKFKLLFDTIELLHFRLSDREKSSQMDKLEKTTSTIRHVGQNERIGSVEIGKTTFFFF